MMCEICFEWIKYKDDYCKIEDFSNRKSEKVIYLHKNCFKDRLSDLVNANEIASQIIGGMKA